jgi:hypothetical protein
MGACGLSVARVLLRATAAPARNIIVLLLVHTCEQYSQGVAGFILWFSACRVPTQRHVGAYVALPEAWSVLLCKVPVVPNECTNDSTLFPRQTPQSSVLGTKGLPAAVAL